MGFIIDQIATYSDVNILVWFETRISPTRPVRILMELHIPYKDAFLAVRRV